MFAVAKVFALPELIEEILSQATMADVLRSQRINKAFKCIIDTSPRLQEKLFFKAIEPYDPEGNRVEARFSDLLFTAFGDLQYKTCIRDVYHGPARDEREVKVQVFHLHFTCNKDRRKMLRPGTWERMLPMQPPHHEWVTAEASFASWRTSRGGQQAIDRNLDGRKQNPTRFKALKKLIVEMRKQSRMIRGVPDPQGALKKIEQCGEKDGDVDLAIRTSAL